MQTRHLHQGWARLLAVILIVPVSGLHWPLLQVIAWTGMMAVNLPESGFREGLVDTFSGEKPCALCCAIKEGRKTEEKQTPAPLSELKRELLPTIPATGGMRLNFPGSTLLPCELEAVHRLQSWNETPEPPPPRRELALHSI